MILPDSVQNDLTESNSENLLRIYRVQNSFEELNKKLKMVLDYKMKQFIGNEEYSAESPNAKEETKVNFSIIAQESFEEIKKYV